MTASDVPGRVITNAMQTESKNRRLSFRERKRKRPSHHLQQGNHLGLSESRSCWAEAAFVTRQITRRLLLGSCPNMFCNEVSQCSALLQHGNVTQMWLAVHRVFLRIFHHDTLTFSLTEGHSWAEWKSPGLSGYSDLHCSSSWLSQPTRLQRKHQMSKQLKAVVEFTANISDFYCSKVLQLFSLKAWCSWYKITAKDSHHQLVVLQVQLVLWDLKL